MRPSHALIAALALATTAYAADPVLLAAVVPEPAPTDGALSGGVEYRTAPDERPIYRKPSFAAALRGTLERGEPFAVHERVAGPGCTDGWARVDAGGFICLNRTKATTERPAAMPRMPAFDAPTPDEYWRYTGTRRYDRLPAEVSEGYTPHLYGKPYQKFKGNIYKSVAAYEAGAAPLGQLSRARKQHFLAAQDTTRGTVFTREDGTVVPADDLYVYPISRHHGRDLVQRPLPDGLWPAWAISYEGAKIHRAPDAASPVAAMLPHHAPLVVRSQPADPSGHWWEVPDALGAGVPGYVEDTENIRHPVPRNDLPFGVSGDEVWIDVDLEQQMLHLYRGDRLEFVTLVATGTVGHGTPKGTYRITGKNVTWDMASRANATDVYYVEDVPWTMHFWPRYAIHGAYWHWGLGRIASHGCVNLAPRDAKWVFDHTDPQLPPGWRAIYPSPEDKGTTIRVRAGLVDGPVRETAADAAFEAAPLSIGPTDPPG